MITKTDQGRHLSGLVYYIINLPCYVNSDNIIKRKHRDHRDPKQSVCVTDCLYFIVNVLDLPFASPTAIYINHCFPQANFFHCNEEDSRYILGRVIRFKGPSS